MYKYSKNNALLDKNKFNYKPSKKTQIEFDDVLDGNYMKKKWK